MTIRSDFISALMDLRILEGEPGVQQRWQEIIRKAITAMESAQDHLPAEPLPTPVPETKQPESTDDKDAEAKTKAAAKDAEIKAAAEKSKVTTSTHVAPKKGK